jgi:hypothetical protein
MMLDATNLRFVVRLRFRLRGVSAGDPIINYDNYIAVSEC